MNDVNSNNGEESMALAMRGMSKDFTLMKLMESRVGYSPSLCIIDDIEPFNWSRLNPRKILDPKTPDWKHPIPVPVSNPGPSAQARAKLRAKRKKRK